MAHAVKAAQPDVVVVYPTVPPSTIMDHLCDFSADGSLRARMVKVEAAHSALSTLIGASATGARTFTATSSQGLALMHEMLHWAAGDRFPIVVANVNRALGAPWSIWVDHNDSFSQRDTGWIQFYASTSQEAHDMILIAYKLGELVQLPVLVNLDGFYLSRTIEPVMLPEPNQVDSFLPPFETEWQLDPKRPRSIGNLTSPDYYLEFRYKIQQAMDETKRVAGETFRQFAAIFGRKYSCLETYEVADAEVVFITYATMAETVRHTVREMRSEGHKVGLIRLRMFRPFPVEQLLQLLNPACCYIVLDRNISFGAGGILGQETKAALYSSAAVTRLYDITLGLGGRDITPAMIREIALKYPDGKHVPGTQYWEGVRL